VRRLLLFCIALLALTACQPQSPEAKELEAFAAAFQDANQASNIEPMLALYQLKGSTKQTVNLLKNALLYERGLPIQSIDFEPLSGSPEETIYFKHQSVQYEATLEPSRRMRVRYGTEDGFESLFTIGQNADGTWRIVSSRPKAP
jgi:hypothetical protein